MAAFCWITYFYLFLEQNNLSSLAAHEKHQPNYLIEQRKTGKIAELG